MRSVSSATWTSADPVSPSVRPYLPISSAFFSAVRVILGVLAKKRRDPESRPLEGSTGPTAELGALERLCRGYGLGQNHLRIRDIQLHLRDQILDSTEALLPPQARHEGHPQLLPVEVFVAVDHVGLDQHAPARL